MLYCLAKKILFKSIFLFQKTPENFIPKVIFIPITTGIGNLILKTTTFRHIKNNYPNSKLILYCDYPNNNYKILENSPYIDKIIINKKTFSFFKYIKQFLELRKLNIDTVILPFDVSMNYFYYFLCIIKPKKRIGHMFKNRNIEESLFNEKIEFNDITHEIDLNLNLLEPLNILNEKIDYKTELYFEEIEKQTKPEYNYIVIQVGAANGTHSLKILPIEGFIIIIEKIIKFYPNYKIIFIGTNEENNKAKSLKDKLNSNNIINKCGKTDLPKLISILNDSSLIICHDSGIMHIGNALNIPLIALYGATNIKRTKPLGKNSHIVKSDNNSNLKIGIHSNSQNDDSICKIEEKSTLSKIDHNKIFEKIKEIL